MTNLPEKIIHEAFDWQETSMGNEFLQGEGFYISYNSAPCAGISFFASDDGQEETALCVEMTHDFFILNGDFRNEYEKAFPSLEACKLVYEKNKDHNDSSWSNT